MSLNHAPIITAGQLFYNEEINEYLIVTNNLRGQIFYQGVGFKGSAEDETFIERFQPVDPIDVDADELNQLAAFCAPGTTPKIGYIIA